MAVIAQRGRIVITPTAWKWYLGAGLLAVLALSSKALVVLVASAFLVLTGSGLVNRITLDEGGFKYRNYATRKRYRGVMFPISVCASTGSITSSRPG